MRAILVAIAFFTTASIGWADTVITYHTKDQGPLVISYRDDNHIRMDTGEDSYMLVTGGKVYGVSRENGKWTAVDMEQVGRLGRSLRFGGQKGEKGHEVAFQKTGRTEKIAGYKGDVYIVEVTEEKGRTQEHEMVLGKHHDLQIVNRVWRAFGEHLGSAMQMKNLQGMEYQTKQEELGAALRYEDQMIMQSLTKQSLSASHYELPKGVGQADIQTAPGGSAPKQDDVVTDTAKKAEDAAKDEAQDSVVHEVGDQVRGVFRKMFD